MKQLSIKSNIVLGSLLVLTLLLYFFVEFGKIEVKKSAYKEKLKAAHLTQQAFEKIKQFRLKKGIILDPLNDLNKSHLIGQEYSLITTGHGVYESKLLSTNPNFSAVLIEMLKQAGLKEGDRVAVGMTGSFPALNIATLIALQTLNIQPITISSVGASNWGANDPNFTWLDMESLLVHSGILKQKSVAASLGGNNDEGRGLSPKGRALLERSIRRNKIPLIRENTLSERIEKRLDIYRSIAFKAPIRAYINIGGGIASLGHPLNKELISPGLTQHLPDLNYPARGVLHSLAETNIPIIQLVNIKKLYKSYGLTADYNALSTVGLGAVFSEKNYSLIKTIFATLFLLVCVFMVYSQDKKARQLGKDRVLKQSDLKNKCISNKSA